MEFPTFNLEELYQAVKERALAEGAYAPEEWSDMIDAVIQDREEFAEVHADEELSAVKEQLKERYPEFKSEIPEA